MNHLVTFLGVGKHQESGVMGDLCMEENITAGRGPGRRACRSHYRYEKIPLPAVLISKLDLLASVILGLVVCAS
jgi:hypothetical protein